MRVSIVASAFLPSVTRWLNRHSALTFSSAAPPSHAHPPHAVFPSDGPPISWGSNSTVRRWWKSVGSEVFITAGVTFKTCFRCFHWFVKDYILSHFIHGVTAVQDREVKACVWWMWFGWCVSAAPFWLKIHNGLTNFTFSSLHNLRLLLLFTGDLSASDTSLVDLVERHRGPLPQELMPLPSQDRDSPLEWTHLVDVANTFESERNTHYGIKNYCTHLSFYVVYLLCTSSLK